MNKELVRREVRGAILGELTFRMKDLRGNILEQADQLTDAVMKCLETLDATVLERDRHGS